MLSLRGLEVFDAVARSGSLQHAADLLGLSISTVSHHLGRLEADVDVMLIDRSTRPMTVTDAGRSFLAEIRIGLTHIRLARNRLRLGFAHGATLRIALVDDVEATIAPDLAVMLEASLPQIRLVVRTAPSDHARGLLEKGQIDHAFAAMTVRGGVATPILRDPFVLVVPRTCELSAKDCLSGKSGLPFLRFSARHVIGQQIEAHLARNGIQLENRREIDSNAAIMTLVARGRGFAVTTPVGYLRAARTWPDVDLLPLPNPKFSRTLGLMSRSDGDPFAHRAITNILKTLIARDVIAPAVQRYPWLDGSLELLDEDETASQSDQV